jgi:hypothetical protein
MATVINGVQHVRYPFQHRGWTRDVEIKGLLAKRTVMNIHRGGGKTFYSCHKLIEAALKAMDEHTPGKAVKRYAYIGMSISHATQTAWDVIFKVLLADFMAVGLVTMNGNDHVINFLSPTNGKIAAQILLSGYDTPEKNRGIHVHGMVLDEAQSCPINVWAKILAPTLVQNNGWVIMIGTPNGPQGLFYNTWVSGNATAPTDPITGLPKRKVWTTITRTVDDTGEIDQDEMDALKESLTESDVQQEYYCSFEAAVNNRVYYNFDTSVDPRVIGGKLRLPHRRHLFDRGGDLYIGLDFNVGKMVAIIGQKWNNTLEIIGEIVLTDCTTDDMCVAIKHNYPGRRIFICPDASGSGRTTQTTDTNHSLLRQHGFKILTPKKNPAVSDRISAVNVLLQNANGERRLFVNNSPIIVEERAADPCLETGRTLRLHQKNSAGIPDKKSGLDHAGDALGYLVYQTFPIQAPAFYKRKPLRV